MEEDRFEQVVKDRLGNHKMPVDSALWKSVAAQAGISAGSTGLGFGAWLGIVVSGVALTAAAVYFSASKQAAKNEPKAKQATETVVKEPGSGEAQKMPTKDKEEEKAVELRINAAAEESTPGPVVALTEQNREDNRGQQNAELLTPPISPAQRSSDLGNHEVTPVEPQIPTLAESKQNTLESHSEKRETKPLVMPNAITPNGDGVNDVLTLSAEGLTDFSVVILDVKNKLVYSSTDVNFAWNGTLLNGDPAPAGVYQYYYTAKDATGTWCNQFSMLTLLR